MFASAVFTLRCDMRLRCLLLLLVLSRGALWAQQNVDFFTTAGDPGSRAFTVAGSNVTAAGSHAFVDTFGFGYQIKRLSTGSLWLELSEIWGAPDDLQASVPSIGKTTWQSYAAGGRYMVPVYKRLSLYAACDVGGGLFHAIALHPGGNPGATTIRTYHGVFEFGGGLDVRLLRWFSLRAELRDLVTGRQLSDAAGRQHILPTFGIAFHH